MATGCPATRTVSRGEHSTSRHWFRILLAISALAASSRAQEPALEEWVIDRSDLEQKLPDGVGLAIENLHGDVRVRVGEPGKLYVHAVAQRHRDDPRHERIEAGLDERGAALRVLYPEDESTVAPAWARRRVDLAVEVPPAARLSVVTESGLIEIKGHSGELTLRSVAGDVRLWIEGGPADVRTDRGSVVAVLRGPDWRLPSRFETTTGDIEVHFPTRTDVDVRLQSQGPFTTDYTLQVERVSPLTKRGFARLGRGGPEVVLTSGHGALSLVALIPAVGAEPPGQAPGSPPSD